MPVIMHFSTSLKFLTLDTGDKIRHLAGYATPGGFDFYRSSRDAVLQHSAHGRTRERVIKDIASAAPHNAVAHNVEIFEHAANWLEKQKGKRVTPSRGVWPSPNRVFSVHIEPEIGLEVGETKKIIAVYPRREPRLNRDTAGAGLLLLEFRGQGIPGTVYLFKATVTVDERITVTVHQLAASSREPMPLPMPRQIPPMRPQALVRR